ncbi:hypothetical protein DDP54_03390 [Cellulomonas sp. WB94]|uniref:SDR family NAD(P)-dependent oxidoreductase n=1 Tax=Cellulomonas sp. WB94 TaxID=2173174 RepID=UPI000D570462|nr:SDR family NAD(P)-dependent oxidoreductase [Cellulomonas sp. WB94]PVU82207.1 hypothetical protein DDP54_03390 [Cellulomonas sp. WB94]
MSQFDGRTIVITGGADGISKRTAQLMAERGAAAIVIGDINADLAAQTAAEITAATSCAVTATRVDVSDPESIAALFTTAIERMGRLDVLVNGAGIMRTSTIEQSDAAAWDLTCDINLRGTFLCAREAFTLMKPRGYGRIVNVASVAARIGGIASGVEYAASKGGVVAATKSLAKLGGPFAITVNAVAPSVIRTKMTEGTAYSAAGIPLGRLGEVEDVAYAIAFLASDEAAYITGTTLDVNGGSYMN